MDGKKISASVPRGPVIEIITLVMRKENAARYVPQQARRRLKNKAVSGLHAKMSPTILVRILIRKHSDICKRNVILKELRTNVEVVARI